MALRQLIISKKLSEIAEREKTYSETEKTLRERREALETREANAESAFAELTENSTEEEKSAFDTEADAIEAEKADIEKAENELTEQRNADVSAKAELEKELEALNKSAEVARSNEKKIEIRKDEKKMENMTIRELMANDEVKNFVSNMRTAIQNRAVTGANLTFPVVVLPLLKAAIARSSKLYDKVNVQKVHGEGRQPVIASVPFAAWVANPASVPELTAAVNAVTLSTNKLAGYLPIPVSAIEDSDEDLANIVIEVIGQSLGQGLDKAILYGTGSTQPVGIMTRLAATGTEAPAWWDVTAPAFKSLATTNIKKSASGSTGAKLFSEMIKGLGTAKEVVTAPKGKKFFAMASTTFTTLQAEGLSFNASGALVSGINMQMPGIGGDIVILDFIPDGDIIGGYGSNYILGEGAGVNISSSADAKFIEDLVIFKGTGRYDGKPVIGEAFAAFNVNATNVTTTLA